MVFGDAGSVSHSLVVLTEGVAEHADHKGAPLGQQSSASSHSSSSGGGISSSGISDSGSGIGSNNSQVTSSPSLISRLTNTSKMSQQTKEQIAYFSRTTSGGIVLPLSSACNYSFK